MNTRSVRNKAQFVKFDDHGIDIVALTETWLSDGEVVDVLTNGGYNLVHLPRKNRCGGGVGLLFRSTCQLLSHKPMTTGTFECINVTLRCQRTKVNIQLLVVYRPPSSSLSRAFLDDFTQLLNNVANTRAVYPEHNQSSILTLSVPKWQVPTQEQNDPTDDASATRSAHGNRGTSYPWP